MKTLIKMTLAALALLALFASYALAETIAIATPGAPVDLTKGGQIVGSIERVADAQARKALKQSLKGAFRIVKGTDGSANLQIFWDELSTPDGKYAVSLSPRAVTHHPLSGPPSLPGDVQFKVEGTIASLATAGEALAERVAQGDAEDKPKEEDTAKDTKDDSKNQDSTGSGNGTSTAGSGSLPFSNDLGSSLPNMSVVRDPVTGESTVVHDDVYGTTTNGCDPVFDEAANVMIITEAPTKNGETTGPCEEGIKTLEIKETFIGCNYEEDLTALTAHPKRRRYYTNGGNTTYLDNTCTTDETVTYVIEEDVGSCGLITDYIGGSVDQATRLVYRGAQNEEVEAQGCKVRDGAKTFPIEMVTDECSLVDYFDLAGQGKSVVQEQATYVGDDGLRRPLGVCEETQTFYLHVKDTSVCDPFVDYAANQLYEQFKIRIDTPDGAQYRTQECQVEASALTALTETGTGCETYHYDYNGYSNGATRITRNDTGEEVRGCQEAAVAYPHERLQQGWSNDDANLQAWPLEALYITLPNPVGQTIVEPAVVRDDATPTAYTYVNQTTEQGDNYYLDAVSCDQYTTVNLVDNYTRPDGTGFQKTAGTGTPIGPTYDCSKTIPGAWSLVSTWGGSAGCTDYRGVYAGGGMSLLYGEYTGTYKITRGDGVIITDETDTESMVCATSGCGISNHGINGTCADPNIVNANTWNSARGWF